MKALSKMMIKKTIFNFFIVLTGLFAECVYAGGGAPNYASASLGTLRAFSSSGFTQDIEDMRIQTQGGPIRIVRTRTNGVWEINRRWNPVHVYTLNPSYKGVVRSTGCPDGVESCYVVPESYKSVETYVERNDVKFSSNKGYVNGHERFEVDTSGISEDGAGSVKYRWTGKNGDWIEYEKSVSGIGSDGGSNPFYKGVVLPTAFGRPNEAAQAKFVYNSDAFLTKLTDANGENLYLFDYMMRDAECTDFGAVECQRTLTKITDYTGRSVQYSPQTEDYDASLTCVHPYPQQGALETYDCAGLTVTGVRGAEESYLASSYATRPSQFTPGSAGSEPVARLAKPGDRPLIKTFGKISAPAHKNTYLAIDANGRRSVVNAERGFVLSKLLYGDEQETGGVGLAYKFEHDSEKNEYYSQERYTSGRVVEKWSDAKDGETIRKDINGATILVQENQNSSVGRVRKKRSYSGLITTDELDEKYNLIKRTHPDESTEEWTYGPFSRMLSYKDENDVFTEYEYDDFGNLLRKIEAKGTAVERVIEYTRDQYGNKLTETRLGNATTGLSVTSWTYDNYGNISSRTDPENFVTQYEDYDALGNYGKMTDARGKVWLFSYDPDGNLLSMTTPLGFVTSYKYDGVGNRIEKTDAKSNVTTYGYDERDNLIKTTNAYNHSQFYTYDHDDRITSFVDEEGVRTELEYDESGRLIAIKDGGDNVTCLYYGEGENTGYYDIHKIEYPTFTQTLSYDERGRIREQVTELPEGVNQTTRYSYGLSGKVETITDPKSRVTKIEYDELYRTTQIIDALNKTVALTYDNRDNIRSVTNQNDAIIREFSYDKRDNTTTEIWPNGSRFVYTYDEDNNRIESTDAKGQVTRFSYDDDLRLIQEAYFSDDASVDSEKTVNYTYNALDSLLSYTDSTTSGTFTYDNLQRKLSETINYGSFTKGHNYSYKKNDLKASFTGPDEQQIQYSYNSNNQLNRIQLPGVGSIGIPAYKWQQPAQITYPGGATTAYAYNGLPLPLRIESKDPANNTQLDFQYQYDLVNNITDKVTEHGSYSYSYDELDRLISSQSPVENTEWDYDGTGNRIRERFFAADQALNKETEWGYNATNQLQGYGDNSFIYDLNGNNTKKTDVLNGVVTDYHYNVSDRLSRVTNTISGNTETIAEYYYDPFGRRLWKDTVAGKQYFHYSDEGLIAELDASGSVTQSYGFGTGNLWATDPVYTRANGEYYFYHNDHLGTPQQLSDISGAKVWGAEYKAFGEAAVSTELIEQNLRFPGQRYDVETGLHQNYFRDYSPHTGQYLTSDPIGLYGGVNTYGYAYQSPVNYSDPRGLYVNLIIGAGIRIIGGGTAGAAIAAAAKKAAGPVAGWAIACILTGYCSEASDGGQSESENGSDGGNTCPIPGTTPGRKTKGRTKQLKKTGDFDSANSDFDDLNPTDVVDLPGGGRRGTLPDGRPVNVRPNSSDGRPTIEIQNGKNKIKVRYLI